PRARTPGRVRRRARRRRREHRRPVPPPRSPPPRVRSLAGPSVTPRDIPAKLEHFIGGAHTASADGATFEVADPVTNRPYATVAAGGPNDVDHAVAIASAAFTEGPWPQLPSRARARVLARIADGIEARAQRVAELETFATGLPVTQARGQAARAAENFRFFADLAVTLHEDAFRTNEQFGY